MTHRIFLLLAAVVAFAIAALLALVGSTNINANDVHGIAYIGLACFAGSFFG